MDNVSPYELLGVSEVATADTIKAAYRDQVKRHHPDRFLSYAMKLRATQRMQAINQAYEVLSDPDSRRRYDDTAGTRPNAASRSEDSQRTAPPPPTEDVDTRWLWRAAFALHVSISLLVGFIQPYGDWWMYAGVWFLGSGIFLVPILYVGLEMGFCGPGSVGHVHPARPLPDLLWRGAGVVATGAILLLSVRTGFATGEGNAFLVSALAVMAGEFTAAVWYWLRARRTVRKAAGLLANSLSNSVLEGDAADSGRAV